jgi:hypothetical protein
MAEGPVVNVPGGMTTVQDIDLTGGFSMVRGVVSLNGSPVFNPYLDVNHQGLCQAGGSDGSFAFLLPPRAEDYGVAVRPGQQKDAVGGFYISVPAAGQLIDLGVVEAIPLVNPIGTLYGTVFFNGAPFQPVGANTSSCGLVVQTSLGTSSLSPEGSFSQGVMPFNGSTVPLNCAWVTHRVIVDGGLRTNSPSGSRAASAPQPTSMPPALRASSAALSRSTDSLLSRAT